MADVKEYKCLNCQAGLKFHPTAGNWKCDFCFSEFSKEQLDEAYGKEDLSKASKEEIHEKEDKQEGKQDKYYGEESSKKVNSYHCTSCGAELIADETTSATFCAYCKNPTIIKQRFTGKFQPKHVIPFKVTEEEAKDIYKKWIQKKLFIPKGFKEDEVIDKISGIYAPFWIFDCHLSGNTKGEGEKVRTWRSGDYRYTETRTYHVERHGKVFYDNIPVDSSKKLDDTFMQMIEPFDYKDMEEFSMHYMTGFFAERYDVEKEESEKVMHKRANEYFTARLQSSVNGYSSYREHHGTIRYDEVSTEYALMPIYLIMNKYEGKEHIFIINGQTGKMVGDSPISKGRQLAFAGSVFLGSSLLAMIGGALIGMF